MSDLERRFPWIEWREPIAIHYQDGKEYWACRLCIAQRGLQGRDVPHLPTDREQVVQHIAREHPRPQGAQP